MNPAQPGPGGAHDPLAAPAGFSLVEFATRRRVTVAMMTLTLVLFGLIALGSLKVNLLPDLSYPTLTVRTDYTGAAPSEVETLISQPAEEALGVVKGLRKLKSVSRTGQSDVVLEFAWGTDMDQASLDVRDKMEALQFPLEAEPPVLLRFNPSTQPIMRLALSPKDTDTGAAEEIRKLMELRRPCPTCPPWPKPAACCCATTRPARGSACWRRPARRPTWCSACSRRTSTSPAGAWRRAPSVTWCAPSTSSPPWRRSATCCSPRARRRRAAVPPTRRCGWRRPAATPA